MDKDKSIANCGMQNSNHADVSLVRCTDYERDTVLAAVRRAVDLIGGIGTFVKTGERVLIKPNLLKASPPEKAVTTHPEIVRAVIRLVRESGAAAVVGDSPGLGDLRRVCGKSGVLKVIEEEGADIARMDDAVTVKGGGRFHHFEIARAVQEADVVINLPKLKTHGMMTVTGAVKNLFGCIPGRRKVQWHLNAGVNRSAFARMLLELSAVIKPKLTIMDAVVGMEGNGPGSGDPRKVGLLIAGQDPVSVDVVSGTIIGADPAVLPVIKAAAEAGIGETRLDMIRVHGELLESVLITGFRLPAQEHTEWRLPEWARRLLKDALTTRPEINPAECIQCGVCKAHCPQAAIRDSEKGLRVRYRECIRCFCCQEFCPQGAITVGRGWALRLLPQQRRVP